MIKPVRVPVVDDHSTGVDRAYAHQARASWHPTDGPAPAIDSKRIGVSNRHDSRREPVLCALRPVCHFSPVANGMHVMHSGFFLIRDTQRMRWKVILLMFLMFQGIAIGYGQDATSSSQLSKQHVSDSKHHHQQHNEQPATGPQPTISTNAAPHKASR